MTPPDDPRRDDAPPLTLSAAALLRLAALLSPSFPIGSFAYSHGLERAIADGDAAGPEALTGWLETLLAHGAFRNDAHLLAAAWRAERSGDVAGAAEAAALGRALAAAKERRLETLAQGAAFLEAARAGWGVAPRALGPEAAAETPYPAALGLVAAAADCPLAPTLRLALQSMTANLVSAGIRLIPIGQSAGQRVLAQLADAIETAARAAEQGGLDDLGGAAFRSDLAAIRHETQTVRLFRT